ncbi:MAG: flagellar motor protein MotB [Neolewinella sp.]|jgi:chemotaxis protein MotB
MRLLLLLLSSIIITSCIAPKKVELIEALHDDRVAHLESGITFRQDSIVKLNSALDRALGGKDALMIAQGKLEDKLVAQKDQIDALSGSLNSTSSRMNGELADTREELEAANLRYDTLLLDQQNIIEVFQQGLVRADAVLMNALEANIPDNSYTINVSAGEVSLSVQEGLLFESRASEKLNDEAAVVLRAVLDALQSDPLLKLIIVGHTDNEPNPRRNTDNWEYAALRAIFLAEELADTYYLSSNRVVAASNGEFSPAKSNATPEGRTANRRIDFVLRNNVGNLLRNLKKLGEE